LFHGGSERFGIVFNLYELDEVSQYSWPLERILVFVPIAIIITLVAIYQIQKILRPVSSRNRGDTFMPKQSLRIIDLMTVTGFIGALSIWPAKISVFYAFFLVVAIYAFNRLDHRFAKIK